MYKRVNTVITKVVDGDTIHIECEIGNQPCRLKHIDAPEKGQWLYRESKQYILDHWCEKDVWCTATAIDRYGRWIVEIEDYYGNMLHWELLKKGLAFHFKKYSKDFESSFFEKQARNEQVGLWADPQSYSRWKQYLKNKEDLEKKNEEESTKIPYLILIFDNDNDGDFDCDEVPEFMVYTRNFKTIKLSEFGQYMYPSLSCNDWNA